MIVSAVGGKLNLEKECFVLGEMDGFFYLNTFCFSKSPLVRFQIGNKNWYKPAVIATSPTLHDELQKASKIPILGN